MFTDTSRARGKRGSLCKLYVQWEDVAVDLLKLLNWEPQRTQHVDSMAPRREPAYLQVARADDDAGEWEDDKEDPGASILEATQACTTPTGAQAWTEAAMPMEMAAQKVNFT